MDLLKFFSVAVRAGTDRRIAPRFGTAVTGPLLRRVHGVAY